MASSIYRCRICGAFTEDRVHCGVETELFLDARRRVMLSKLMSGLLRHYPREAGLRIDSRGWVSIDDLVEGIRARWRNRHLYQWVTRDHVIAVALLDPKGRFEVRDGMIRARYGHSISVSIDYEPCYPPQTLYHGTSADRLEAIMREGLKPMKRRFVHMTTRITDAIENARRHGNPVVLAVDIECLRSRGIPVYKASETVYLAPRVPPECIKPMGRRLQPSYTQGRLGLALGL